MRLHLLLAYLTTTSTTLLPMTTRVTNHLISAPQKETLVFLCVLCALFLWQQTGVNAATTTTTVEANIVSSINIEALNGIAFGDISSSSTAGTVNIDTNGSRTATGGVTINTSTSGSAANFEVSGDPNGLYDIALPPSVVLTSTAGDNMTVDNFSSTPDTSGQLSTGGTQSLSIAARLNVGSFQPFGAYSGLMATTVEYN